eukprot:CAMPEP_0194226600 /NCGR_PEP_ID=MMETSP0156-20130528/42199_1 /TAXON_ID=33649 /ORGANISM="Thalassionema nitzschioides, Strain L26-B" /LENGTH=302 /DNA_ID=CAMNT_0038959013 /DNA_START=9 /DNA_END=918 /DNA_ORIENTATION=-
MISRRSILFDSIALATTAGSIASSNNKDSTSFLQPSCLDLHLPPKPTNAVRLYLCRHGQTENNRLHKLQGGNVNPPLNENGFLMAARLGKTLQKNIMNADGPTHRHHSPTLIYHSTMLRAQQTAESAAAQFSHKIDKKSQMPLRTIGLDSLVELDYSLSSWGKKDTIMPSREEVQRIYDRWAAGYIDEPLGKESARDILNRCAQALTTMVEGARAEKSRSVVAVAHGSYLRFLLACALDLPLAKYATNIRLDNGSISVLDVELETEPILRTLNNSNFFIESDPGGGSPTTFLCPYRNLPLSV